MNTHDSSAHSNANVSQPDSRTSADPVSQPKSDVAQPKAFDHEEATDIPVPGSFPKGDVPFALPGSQPKLSARLIDGKYVVGMTPGEIRERYEVCLDLVGQLITYGMRKRIELPELSLEDLVERIGKGVVNKGWGFSPTEVAWMKAEVLQALKEPSPGAGSAQDVS